MDIFTDLSLENIDELLRTVKEYLDHFKILGPLPGIFLPFVEAFLPFLPLFVFVFANSLVYGLFYGFLFSWIGASLGSIMVFFLIRKLKHKRFVQKVIHNKQVDRVISWVDRKGFGLLFLLLCFPFSPSSIINAVAGLSSVNKKQFILAVLLGKAVMIFSISYVGTSVLEFAKNPIKTIVIIVCISIFWIFGKYLEKKLIK